METGNIDLIVNKTEAVERTGDLIRDSKAMIVTYLHDHYQKNQGSNSQPPKLEGKQYLGTFKVETEDRGFSWQMNDMLRSSRNYIKQEALQQGMALGADHVVLNTREYGGCASLVIEGEGFAYKTIEQNKA